MATAQFTPVSSIKARISALNLEQVNDTAPAPAPAPRPYNTIDRSRKAPPPPPPPRNNTLSVPPEASSTALVLADNGPPLAKAGPSLPPRPASTANANSRPVPGLPPRRPSENKLTRRPSTESVASTISVRSNLSTGSSILSRRSSSQPKAPEPRMIAPAYDPSSLPALPPKKEEKSSHGRRPSMPSRPTKSAGNVAAPRAVKAPPVPIPAPASNKRPTPPLPPQRPALPQRKTEPVQEEEEEEQPRRAVPPLPPASRSVRSALSFAMNKSTETAPPIPNRQSAEEQQNKPPPIPLSSRPNLDAIMASKPSFAQQNAVNCLVCRDFSGPDQHAARFPTHAIPSTNIAWLSEQLTSPFSSATDKARAIFTWEHHNINYDVVGFKNLDKMRHKGPEDVIISGLAVCQGYAEVFVELAKAAGLNAKVVSGHGKGAGHQPLKPGQPVPKYSSNHAWAVCQIDRGEWKLIDPCWGAGNVCGDVYTRAFKPEFFTMSNNEFGLRHFPTDQTQFYRTDGRDTFSWEEYVMDDAREGGKLTVYGNTRNEHSLATNTFSPPNKQISVYDPNGTAIVRFQCGVPCEHFNPETHGEGKPYPLAISVEGVDGRKKEFLPVQTNGKMWWCDVPRRQLGAPGQKVQMIAFTTCNGKDTRGMPIKDFMAKLGRVGYGYSGLAEWELV